MPHDIYGFNRKQKEFLRLISLLSQVDYLLISRVYQRATPPPPVLTLSKTLQCAYKYSPNSLLKYYQTTKQFQQVFCERVEQQFIHCIFFFYIFLRLIKESLKFIKPKIKAYIRKIKLLILCSNISILVHVSCYIPSNNAVHSFPPAVLNLTCGLAQSHHDIVFCGSYIDNRQLIKWHSIDAHLQCFFGWEMQSVYEQKVFKIEKK